MENFQAMLEEESRPQPEIRRKLQHVKIRKSNSNSNSKREVRKNER
jgi:hypothetical protein